MGELLTQYQLRKTSTTWKTFAKNNPGEAQREEAFITALDAGEFDTAVPKMVSPFGQGDLGMLHALAKQIQVVTPPPPPPPPPSGSVTLRNIYVDPSSWSSNYSAQWDAIKASLPNLEQGIMAPLDASVVKHVGVQGQVCLIPAGYTEAQFVQYGVPCWNTGLVDTFVTVDEPGSDSGSINRCKTVAAYVKKNCTGNNKKGQPVKTMVTAYAASTLQILINNGVADQYGWDNYPNRTGWDFASWQQGITVLDNAGVPYIVVIGIFDAPNYPMPSVAQAQQYVAKAKATKAYGLNVYAYGKTGSATGKQLENDPQLMAVVATI